MQPSNKTESVYSWGLKAPIFLIPFLSLYVSPSLEFPFVTGKNFAFRILIEFAGVCWLGLYCLNKEYRLRNSPLTMLVLLFTFIVGLADLFGVNPYNSFWSNYERMEGYITILHLALYFIIIKSIFRSEKDWRIFFNIIVISGILVSLCAFILPPASTMSAEFASEYTSRIYSTIGNPPFLASYMLLLVFIGLILLFTSQKKHFKYIYPVSIILNLITIYFSASRGAIVSVAVGLIIFSFFCYFSKTNALEIKNYKRIVVYTVVIFVTAAFFFITLTSSDFIKHDKTLSRFTSLKYDKSVTTRLNAWKMAWNGFKERPILGWGQENFNSIYLANHIPAYEGIILVDRAHNIIIDWMINAGIIGLFTYMMVLGYALFIVWTLYYREKRITKTLFAILFTALTLYFIQNLFTFDTINTYLIYFALLAFIDNIRKNNGKEAGKNDKVVMKNIKLKTMTVTFLSLMMFSSFTYYANFKPIKVSQLTLRIGNAFPQYTSFSKLRDDFNEALSYKTFGGTDVRGKMVEASLQIIRHKLFEIEGAFDFIRRTIKEQLIGAEDNYKDLKYLSNMVGFYCAIARFDPAFVDEAINLIAKCLQVAPYYEEFNFMLAEMYLLKKDYENAFTIIDKAVPKDTLNVRKQLKLAEVAILASREDVVNNALENVKKIRMTRDKKSAAEKNTFFSIQELSLIADTYKKTGNYHKALEYYKNVFIVLSDDKEHQYLETSEKKRIEAEFHFEIANIYLDQGDAVNALSEANTAAELDPQNYIIKAKELINSVNNRK